MFNFPNIYLVKSFCDNSNTEIGLYLTFQLILSPLCLITGIILTYMNLKGIMDYLNVAENNKTKQI